MAAEPTLLTEDRRQGRAAWLVGLAALCLVAIAIAAPLVAVPVATGTIPALGRLFSDSYIAGVLRFTLLQAALSTLLSLALAIPFTLALHRTAFPGRQAVLRLLLLPQALPTLVAALGILAIYGRSGVVSDLMVALGFGRLDIYGLPGILLAHVFFNMPLATRLMLASLSAVPAENWKVAGQLSLGRGATFRLVEWPALRSALPGGATLIFMLCVTSFALVLVLGGGPAATTLEVAIYQALRYDFDPAQVMALSFMQIAIVSLVLVPFFFFGRTEAGMTSLGALARRYDRRSPAGAACDIALVAFGILFVLGPFAAILVNGARADIGALLAQASVRTAIRTSLVIAVSATLLALVLSIAIAVARMKSHTGWRAALLDYAGSIVLVVPPIIIGAGWFLMLRQFGAIATFAPFIVIITNAVMAMPFMIRIFIPALQQAETQQGPLAMHLGLYGLSFARVVVWPALRRPLGLAVAFGLALSLGDLGVVALFGSQEMVTLPYLLLQRMGSYRTLDAAGLALILAVICLVLMWLAEWGATRHET